MIVHLKGSLIKLIEKEEMMMIFLGYTYHNENTFYEPYRIINNMPLIKNDTC